jgi:hypothetical protein
VPTEVLSPDSNKIPSPKTADDINDLFKEIDSDESKTQEKDDSRRTKSGDKETKELPERDDKEEKEEDELELKEPDEEDEEKLDLTKEDDFEIQTPPRKKEILKKYPELFKDYPFLEKMMYRDRQWNEIFGSFDDAKELADKAEVFNSFENQLLAGNTVDILNEVKEADKAAFDKIVDDYLPTLHKVDKEAYYQVVGNLNRRLIMEMVQEANDTNNDDLKQAALLVNQFIFGTSKFTAPQNRTQNNNNGEQNEVQQERINFVKERFETARDDLQTKVDNTLKATIADYIDPKGVMSSYVKKNAVADAMKILTSSIARDPSVVKNLDTLWRTAFNTKFSKDSLGKIQSFYLSKAKGNLKNAILKARSEALKDLAPRHRETDDDTDKEEETRPQRRQISPGRPSQSTGKNQMKKGESVTDFFMRD